MGEQLKPVSNHVFIPLALVFALGISPAAPAESGEFQIAQHGHTVGTASFNLTSDADGHLSTSIVRVSIEGLDYSLSKTESLTSADQLRHSLLSAVVNQSAVNVVVAPDASQLLVKISANGRSTSTQLAAHPAAVVMPDFDPGALETLLALAAAQNNRDLWVILPKQSGSIEPVQLATYADEQGTLDGKPITVHHLVATFAGTLTDIFSDPQNHLLQAELPQAGFALIRSGFVLTPPVKPILPPPVPGDTQQPPPPPTN